jgi:ABC-2 type transport system permease protein
VKAWVLAQKDLRVYFRDRAAVLLGFGLPIVLCTVFGAAMGAIGGGGGAGRVELVVEDRDRSPAAERLLAELAASDGLRLDRIAADSADTARARVQAGDAPAALWIGSGFGAALAAGGELPLVLFRDPGKQIEQQILAGSLIQAFLAALGDELGPRAMARALDALDFPAAGRARAQAILDASWTDMSGLVTELRSAGGALDASGAEDSSAEEAEGFDFASVVAGILGMRVEDVLGGDEEARVQKRAQQAQAVSGMAVMMLLFGLVACGGTLLEEAASGTLDRLRLAPGAASAVLGGKFLFTWIVGLAQLALLFAYGSAVFDVPILRAPGALLVLSTVLTAAVTGFGILFAVLCRTQKQLEGLATIVVLTMSALGGSWWPLAITPEWYRFLAHFTLTAWAMDGFQGIFWYGQGLAGILPETGVLAGIALATTLAAGALWRRRVRV